MIALHQPDDIRTMLAPWNSKLELVVKIWVDPTDIPFEDCHDLEDGEFPEDLEEWEGWDVFVEITLPNSENFTFSGTASLCANWSHRSAIKTLFNQVIDEELIPEAVENLKKTLQDIASGTRVLKAKKEQQAAWEILRSV